MSLEEWRWTITIIYTIILVVNICLTMVWRKRYLFYREKWADASFDQTYLQRENDNLRRELRRANKKYEDAMEVLTTEDDMEYIRESLRRAADGDPIT